MEADYVIVGAGSAGCVLAYRLSDAGKSVLVIEHGGSDAGPFIQMPAALSYPMNMKRYDWGYLTEPEPHLNGRRLAAPRGKVLGGSSSINGMVYVRGHACDFDHWRDSGAHGWGYSDVLPYFKRLEDWNEAGHGGNADWRGKGGPLHVTRGKLDNPLNRAFLLAGKQAGYHATEDYNGEKQEGFCPFEMTVKNGQRWSAANAYLKPALKHENCGLGRGLATRIVFKDGSAIGVEADIKGKTEFIRARKEVVVSASVFNSPKLLMLSGIGPGEHLRELGIEVVADRPGVGRNLQDHLEVYIQMAASKPVSLYKYWNLFGKGMVGLKWMLSKTGPGASNQFESCAFIRSDAGVSYPDIQYHFLPIAVRYDGKVAVDGHGFQAHVGPMRSESRGQVTLRSANPKDGPIIQFNYMSEESDWVDFRKCIRLTREIFSQEAFAPYIRHEIQPGAEKTENADLDEFIREHAESAYHPCGTCKMGRKDDPMAVVDPQGKVIGVENLRVADSSIFPRITNGNLNAPSIMTGEKISDHILGQRLPSDNSKPWMHPEWESRQR
ncbi:MAG: choline dehydrogenase [Roseovarius sp.]|nr:choline dehydrogenase [Roseovarius sp.]